MLAATFVALAALSWGRWTDPLIDTGTELYLPWRIVAGERLYADLAYRHGPLAPHLNALWFALFGVALRTLVVVNLVVLAATTALVVRVLGRAFGALAGTAAGVVLLAAFGFAQLLPLANFNWVTPYQHHQTWGLFLSLAALGALSARRSATAGVCLGLVFLTKAELFVPAAAATATLLLLVRAPRLPFAGAAAAPVALALLALGPDALGNWRHLGGGALDDPFYRIGAGLDAPLANLRRALGAFLGMAAFAGVAAAVGRLPRVAATAVALAATYPLHAFVPWDDVWAGLPLAVAALGVVLARDAKRRPAALAFCVLALLLLAKMVLNARIRHYGFVLALPATTLLVAALVGWARTRALSLAAAAALVAHVVVVSHGHYADKTHPFGEGGDRILVAHPDTDPRSWHLSDALRALPGILPDGGTLLVLPEGVALNYWLRAPSPTRYTLFLPPELDGLGGEAAVVAALRAHPPDVVVLADRPHAEFGREPFGVDPDWGRRLLGWVWGRYQVVRRFGGEPFTEPRFGITILARS